MSRERGHALAKLTLSLRVTDTREDGFHLLDAEMVTVDLADSLTFSEGDGLSIGGPAGVGVPADDSNLIRRALGTVRRVAHVRVDKQIPAGAGLGGGSADAAAVLRWAGCDDVSLAASLGADVPFCLIGGRARVTGIGEIVEPLPFETRRFTLLSPPFSVSTASVYGAWDSLSGPISAGGNDLEPAALVVAPELATWRNRLGEATGETPRLAGSGATWFVEGAFPGDDRLVVTTAAAE
ncbi:MAG: 4-(cytidine 5'-diphospho)-2-C-methyl-D-erythritol kinase [Actinomycetota bacterium]|nr:4-(cytidine 5'-diphospho)-2-C-methyl-D-erythritol kinase [Actinomycetota bacterium]